MVDDIKDADYLFLTFEDIILGNEMEQIVLLWYSLLFLIIVWAMWTSPSYREKRISCSGLILISYTWL